MTRRFLLVAAFLLTTTAHAATHAEAIDALIRAYHQQKQFNGSALVAERGKVILERGFGDANMEWQIPNAPDTRFRLGSITKQFTSMVIMQLVGEGKIKLEDKVTVYLPDYRKETGDRITVHMLLNHTSGIPSYTGLPGFMETAARNPYKVSDFIKKYASNDLEFEPGTKYAYNNSGYFLLGAIIEKVTGKSYEDVIRGRIFEPLGMKDSGYDHSAAVIPHRAAGYVLRGGNYENADYMDTSIPFSAGSLYSTVQDLYKWDRALYTDKLLAPALKQQLFTPGLQSYGFGWVIQTMKLVDDKTTINTISHDGGIPGFNTTIVRMPETQDLIVLLDNTSRGDKIDGLAKDIAGILHGLTPPAPKPSAVEALTPLLASSDVQHVVARYRELKATEPQKWDFSEGQLNQWGYALASTGKLTDAIEIFKLNVENFPQSANVYDSLGEAYSRHGDRDLALTSYRKALALDPKSTSAPAAIKRLEAPAAKIDGPALDKLVGTYELAPGFRLVITREGDDLFGQATGQQKFRLTADSPTEFSIHVVNASITFAPDGSQLVLHQGGRDMTAKRLE